MFLLARYYLRPRHSHQTAQKGYWSKPDAGQLDEQLSFARKLRKSDIQLCNVILDLKEKKIVKCVVDQFTGTDYDRVFDYFKLNYPRHVEAAMGEVTATTTVSSDTVPVDTHAPEVHAAPNGELHVAPAPKQARRRRTQGK